MHERNRQSCAPVIGSLALMVILTWSGSGGAQDLAITEFLARNGANLADEDGGSPDDETVNIALGVCNYPPTNCQ